MLHTIIFTWHIKKICHCHLQYAFSTYAFYLMDQWVEPIPDNLPQTSSGPRFTRLHTCCPRWLFGGHWRHLCPCGHPVFAGIQAQRRDFREHHEPETRKATFTIRGYAARTHRISKQSCLPQRTGIMSLKKNDLLTIPCLKCVVWYNTTKCPTRLMRVAWQ